jgi:hypothetical protein
VSRCTPAVFDTFSNGQEHPDFTTVLLLFLAKGAEKIAFLELKRNQDVARRRDREQKMAGRHPRCRPEGHEEAEDDRVAHIFDLREG